MLTSSHSPGHRLALADTNVVPPAQCPFPSSKFCSTAYSARPEISCSTIDVFRLLRFRFSCLMMTISPLARAMVGPLCFIRKPTVCNTLMKKGSAFRNIEQNNINPLHCLISFTFAQLCLYTLISGHPGSLSRGTPGHLHNDVYR